MDGFFFLLLFSLTSFIIRCCAAHFCRHQYANKNDQNKKLGSRITSIEIIINIYSFLIESITFIFMILMTCSVTARGYAEWTTSSSRLFTDAAFRIKRESQTCITQSKFLLNTALLRCDFYAVYSSGHLGVTHLGSVTHQNYGWNITVRYRPYREYAPLCRLTPHAESPFGIQPPTPMA